MAKIENPNSKETKSQSTNVKQIEKAKLVSRLSEIFPDFDKSAFINEKGNLIKHGRSEYEKLIAKLAENFGENKLNDSELLAVIANKASQTISDNPEEDNKIDAARQLFREMGGKIFPKINPVNIGFEAIINLQSFSSFNLGQTSVFLQLMSKEELSDLDDLRSNHNDEILLMRLNGIIQNMAGNVTARLEWVNLPEEGMEWTAEQKKEYKEIVPKMMEHLYRIALYRDKIESKINQGEEQKKINNIRQKIENSGKQGAETRGGTSKYEPASKRNTQSSEKKEDIPLNDKEKQAKKPKPEEDPEFGDSALRDMKYELGKDGPFKALYSEHKTPEEVKSAVTPEMKRLFLKMMLRDIDVGIYGAKEFVSKNPGSIIGRKGVSQFSGIGVTVGEKAIVYQKMAIAAEGRVISPDEIAVMPMVDYLKRYLGYDLRADKKRAELLKKFTNALS